MINITELRPGNTFEYEGNIFTCLDIALNKTAMAKMKVKVKAKNLRTGGVLELSFIGGDKVELAHLDKKKMQYLYNDGTSLVFMDNETFDQVEIPESRLEWEKNFLKGNEEVTIVFLGQEVLGVNLPITVSLEVTECEPAVKGDTVNKAMKECTTETGYKVKVPLFISEGSVIIVRTDTGEYDGRE